MNVIQPLVVAMSAWRSVARVTLSPRVWAPFLLVAIVQALLLIAFLSFHHPVLLPVVGPVLKLLGGEGAVHYPWLFRVLPTVVFRTNLTLIVFLAALTGGAATLLFAAAYGFGERRGAWGAAVRRLPALLIVSLIATALLYSLILLASLIPVELMQNSRKVRWGVRAVQLVTFVLLQSVFVYASAWIVLRGQNAFGAIRDSARVFARTFLPTLVVVGVPAVLMYPLNYLGGRPDWLIAKFRPEMVAAVIGAQIAAQMVVAFVVVGAVTRLFLWRMEAAR